MPQIQKKVILIAMHNENRTPKTEEELEEMLKTNAVPTGMAMFCRPEWQGLIGIPAGSQQKEVTQNYLPLSAFTAPIVVTRGGAQTQIQVVAAKEFDTAQSAANWLESGDGKAFSAGAELVFACFVTAGQDSV